MTRHRSRRVQDGSGLSRRAALGLLGAVPVTAGGLLATRADAGPVPGTPRSRSGAEIETRIRAIMGRPEFAGARWGMRFQPLWSSRPAYQLNSAQMFQAGSSFKILPGGTAFATLGPDFRFRTRVVRTGPIIRGVLEGDLVLVASGDLLLGCRVRRDGSLELPDPDHSYGADPLPGDPLRTLRDLAEDIRAAGVRAVAGRVRVDTSLFREGRADIAINGAQITVSPFMVNDNVVDVTATPASRPGRPAGLAISPDLSYVEIVNRTRTIAGAAGPGIRPLAYQDGVERPDGTHVVHLTGDVPIDGGPMYAPYYPPGVERFGELALSAALRSAGISVRARASSAGIGAGSFHRHPRTLAVHTSPPLSEAVKVMLKVSSNIHTAHWPYLVGAIAGRDAENPRQRGLELQADLVRCAGLEPDPPGSVDGLYAPDYFVPYLTHLARQPFSPEYQAALPIMGRDGTLSDIQVNAPAAGHVLAKTGTAGGRGNGGKGSLAKALAGYIRLPNGSQVVFAEFLTIPGDFSIAHLAGEALGEIANVVYEELS